MSHQGNALQEAQDLMADFTSRALLEKPTDTFAFAAEHFSTLHGTAEARNPRSVTRAPKTRSASPSPRRHSSVGNILNPHKLLRKKMEMNCLEKLTNIETETLGDLFENEEGVDPEAQTNETATLTSDGFLRMLIASKHPLAKDPELTASFYNALDINGDGDVDRKELLMGLVVFSQGSLDKKLKLSFAVFDINRDGYLEPGELLKVLRIIAELNGHGETPEERERWSMDSFLARFDADLDGKLSYEEFENAAKEDPELQAALSMKA